MTPPRVLYRVEWRVARSHDRPNDRTEQGRNFSNPATAARQVRSIRSWEPSHAELLGVWRTTSRRYNRFQSGRDDGLHWERIDPDTLPLEPHVEAHYAALEASRAGADPATIAALGAGADPEEGTE